MDGKEFYKRQVKVEDSFEPLGQIVFRVMHQVRAKRAGRGGMTNNQVTSVILPLEKKAKIK